MYQNEREMEIQKILAKEQYMTVKQLSQMLYTSESSIRRDLIVLEKRGIVKRSYGGVELAKTNVNVLPFNTRLHDRVREKKIIAEKAASLVHDGDIVFLDQSSSAIFVARAMMSKARVTVITNNIEILSLLSQTDLEVISSGGALCRTNRNCLLGHDAHSIFREIQANFMFFSAKALSEDGVIYDCDREEVCIRNTMLEHAEQKVFLCTSEKIGKMSGYRQCAWSEIEYIITDRGQSEAAAILQDYSGIIM